MNTKENYYRVSDGDMVWTCSPQQLKQDILEWIDEAIVLKIKLVKLTKQEFNELPEFKG